MLDVQEKVPTSPWLDVHAAARYARMSDGAIRQAIKRGTLKSYRTVEGRIRLRVEDVDAFLRGDAA